MPYVELPHGRRERLQPRRVVELAEHRPTPDMVVGADPVWGCDGKFIIHVARRSEEEPEGVAARPCAQCKLEAGASRFDSLPELLGEGPGD